MEDKYYDLVDDCPGTDKRFINKETFELICTR